MDRYRDLLRTGVDQAIRSALAAAVPEPV
jgi:hypothetical protein